MWILFHWYTDARHFTSTYLFAFTVEIDLNRSVWPLAQEEIRSYLWLRLTLPWLPSQHLRRFRTCGGPPALCSAAVGHFFGVTWSFESKWWLCFPWLGKGGSLPKLSEGMVCPADGLHLAVLSGGRSLPCPPCPLARNFSWGLISTDSPSVSTIEELPL